jgi:4-diphosphocytidyl-2-C-methyl-D-erythritol kinase
LADARRQKVGTYCLLPTAYRLPPAMISFPHGKINLGLQVGSKRPDGFHNLLTCFYPVPRTDILEIIPAAEFSFSQSGLNVPGRAEDNLCIKAYQLLKKDFNLGEVKIHLHKMIPMGAGLGGGSSDAAFVLRLLHTIFELGISNEQLKSYASQLGSDCSFFMAEGAMIGTGRGEILSPISLTLKELHLVLVKPDIHVSTAEAYATVVPNPHPWAIEKTLQLPLDQWKGQLKNDFEKPVFEKYPLIGQLKEKLYSFGASYAGLSGSGSCVFGIFENSVDLKNDFSGLDYWSGELK